MTSAKIQDLSNDLSVSKAEECDVCIVGAGAAGSFLARRLWARNISVVLLEAGGKAGYSTLEAGFNPTFSSNYYPSAVAGRAFGLGGSTSVWGGLLAPHTHYDLRPQGDPVRSPIWDHIVAVAKRRGPSVLRLLGFDGEPDFEEFAEHHLARESAALDSAGLGVVASIFLPFRLKNLAHLLEGSSLTGKPPRIHTHAVAKDWHVGSDGRVISLSAVSSNGKRLEVRAKEFVVAAGAIESARILLEIQSSLPDGIHVSPEIGSCLGDHLSVAIADVDRASLATVTHRYAPRFSGSWMRSFRFVESAPTEGAPRAFAHFVFENENAGFRLAKNVLSSIQARRFPRVSARETIAGIGGAVRLAYGRFVQSRLFVPSDTPTRLQLDLEQTPDCRNRIGLGSEIDAFGRRVAAIDWRITDEDMANLRATSERLLSRWEGQRELLPLLVPRSLDFSSEKPHDAYHPVGVCRMGEDETAVVDPTLRVRGLQNVCVVSTGVLPSAGTANPTFTMLCLADEVADCLA